MASLVVFATVAQLLASPPATYVSDMTGSTRAAYEQTKDAPPAELVAALQALSEAGDESAGEFLAELYGFGLLGVARDETKACAMFERLAPRRPDSAHNFATCLYAGRAREQDLPAARQWYARAAEGGWTTSLCGLGNMLIKGEGGETDRPAGLALCRLAAERGDRDAQTDLGGYLLLGEVAERDPIEARRWLEPAAQQRQANAAYLLAQIYWNGDGIDKDPAVARQWWEVAHERGRPDAAFRIMQTILARMTADPDALNRAYLPEAIAWAEIAADREPDAARRRQAAELLASFKRLQDGGQ